MRIGKFVLEKKFLGDFDLAKKFFASELVILQAIDFGNIVEFMAVHDKFDDAGWGMDVVFPQYYRLKTGADGRISSVENNKDVQCTSLLN